MPPLGHPKPEGSRGAEPTRFVGREWILGHIAKWLRDPEERALLLTGPPGAGKTTVAQRIAAADSEGLDNGGVLRDFLAYQHFCRAESDETLIPVRFVEGLAMSLCHHNVEFADALIRANGTAPEIKSTIKIKHAANTVIQGVVIEELHIEPSARSAFDALVRKPLQILGADGGTGGRTVVLVDALDEALTLDARDHLVALLERAVGSTPGLRFLMTGRSPEPRLSTLPAEAVDLVQDAPDPTQDVCEYALSQLQAFPAAEQVELARAVADSTGGIYLLAKHVIAELDAAAPPSPERVRELVPKDLDEVYRRYLRREVAPHSTDDRWTTEHRPVLGVLAVARGDGLTPAQVARATGLKNSTTSDTIKRCSQFLSSAPSPDGPFRIFHRSFQEFLLRDAEYHVFPEEAHEGLAKWCLNAWERDPYAVQHALSHLRAWHDLVPRERRSDASAGLYSLVLDGRYQEARLAEGGDPLTDLRAALVTALSDDDLPAVLSCAAAVRTLSNNDHLMSATSEAIRTGAVDRAIAVLAADSGLGVRLGGWARVLECCLVWGAAVAGDDAAARRAADAIRQVKRHPGSFLAEALLVRSAELVTTTRSSAVNLLDQFGESSAEQLFEKHTRGGHRSIPSDAQRIAAELAALNTAISTDLADQHEEMDRLGDEELTHRLLGLVPALRSARTDPALRPLIDRSLELVRGSAYGHYRDSALDSLGTAVLAVPDAQWAGARLIEILRIALSPERVAFTFDLPVVLVTEASARGIPTDDLEMYVKEAIAADDLWSSSTRALSAQAAVAARRRSQADALELLRLASRKPPAFAGFQTLALLSVANRCLEIGARTEATEATWGPDGNVGLLEAAGSRARDVRDPDLRYKRKRLVEQFTSWWDSMAFPTEANSQMMLESLNDADARRLYIDHVSAECASRSDPQAWDTLKALVPVALADPTALDMVLGRIMNARATTLPTEALRACVDACGQQLATGRPWEASRGFHPQR